MLVFDARYVAAVQLTGRAPKREREISFALSDPQRGTGAINVLCGPNNSGKTYLLRRLREALTGAPCRVANPPNIALTSGREPRVTFTDRLWRDKIKVGTPASSKSLGTPGDVPDLKALTTSLSHRLIQHHLPSTFTAELWQARDERVAWFKAHRLGGPRDGMLLRCEPTAPFTQDVERTIGGLLYLRLDGEGRVDFNLMQGERDVLPFEQWSEGQKTALAVIAMVSEQSPDVVLIDEIENHFHPAYMSGILHWLRARVAQTIVTTHHPHVMFSEHVDRVVFLELRRTLAISNEPPSTVPYLKHEHAPAPLWRATTLERDFDRITQSYSLFDVQDNRLLRHAAALRAQADLALYSAVANARCEELEASAKPLPDRQTQQFAEFLPRRRSADEPLLCLDLGAGVGRVAEELRKLPSLSTAVLRWACWTPGAAAMESLRRALEGHPFAYAVELDEVADASIDVATLANVLHACTPRDAGDLIATASRKLKPESGVLLVAELFPLLRAERFAVPYPQQAIVDIFNDLGYLCATRAFRVFSPLVESAHCTICRVPPGGIVAERDGIRERFDREWEVLLGRAVRSYASISNVRSYADYQSVLQDMTTIASIQAYRAGVW